MAQLEDIDIYSRRDNSGKPLVVRGDKALSNAIIFYLTSRRGDYLRNPGDSGVLVTLDFKNLNASMQNMEVEMQMDLNQRFATVANVIRVTISPNYEKRRWEVEVFYQSLLSGNYVSIIIETNIKIAPTSPVINYIDVPYTDENLEEFVEQNYDKQPDAFLTHEDLPDGSFWVWGKYRLINFSTESANFATILNRINVK